MSVFRWSHSVMASRGHGNLTCVRCPKLHCCATRLLSVGRYIFVFLIPLIVPFASLSDFKHHRILLQHRFTDVVVQWSVHLLNIRGKFWPEGWLS